MPKARVTKPKGTFEWVHSSLDLPPAGIRPSRAGNNYTGSKGKLKCVGCRLSKIKCLYDHSDPDAICANCLRRGLKCGIKIPGPKSQPEVIPMSRGQDRSASQYKDYMRIYHKFKKLRPEDAPANISKLVELVENGTLREEGDKLVVVSLDLGMDLSILEWEPSSHTDRIQMSDFTDGYFSVPGMSVPASHMSIPRQAAMGTMVPRFQLSSPVTSPWLQALSMPSVLRYRQWFVPLILREIDGHMGTAEDYASDIALMTYY